MTPKVGLQLFNPKLWYKRLCTNGPFVGKELMLNFDNKNIYNAALNGIKEKPHRGNEKANIVMSKYIHSQISNNSERQKYIFDSLSSSDLMKMIQNLNDDNYYLRRISALLLCELFYNNSKLKLYMISKLSLAVGHGRVLVWNPRGSVYKYERYEKYNRSYILECVYVMKSKLKKGRFFGIEGYDKMFCWAINFDKKNIDIEFFEFKKYSSFTFLDPQRTVFGFTVIESEGYHETPESPATTYIFDSKTRLNLSTKTPRYTSKDSKLGDGSYRKSSITKKYYFLRPSSRIITSKEKLNLDLSKYKQYTYIKQNESPQVPKHKLGTSIQSISQYARNSYGRQNTEREKPKYNERYSISYYGSGYDSRLKTESFYTRRSSYLETSSSKNKVGSKTPSNHYNFYKRVQDILRK